MNIFGLRIERKAAAPNPFYRALIALIYGRDVVWPDKDYGSLARIGYQKLECVYACVTRVAVAAGGIKWLGHTTTKGKKGERVSVDLDDNHPLMFALRRPNPMQGWSRFCDAAVRYQLLAGNEYMFANAPKSIPPSRIELYNLRPDRMTINPGDYLNLVRSYTYAKDTAAETVFAQEQILHVKEFHPTNDWYGLSPCEVALQDIHTLNLAARWNAKLLQNDARPAGIMTTPAGAALSDQQFERLKKLMKEEVVGAENAGLPVGPLEGGLEFKPYGLSPREMDWLQLDKHTRRKVASVLNVAPELIGDSENKTYSNYQEARKALYLENVLPRMDVLRDELNNWLVPMFGDDRIRVDYDRDSIEAIREDRSKLYTDIRGLVQDGIATRNMALEELGYEQGGPELDVRTVSSATVPLDALGLMPPENGLTP